MPGPAESEAAMAMDKRRIGAAALACAVLAAAAVGWAQWRGPGGQAERASAAAAYGTWIPGVRAETSSGTEPKGCAADHAVDQSGMSGAEAKSQTENGEAGTFWCVRTEKGEPAAITFDLGGMQPLGEMWVWNADGPDSGSDAGLRDATVELSADGETWTEWKGDGYPFRFAKADGSERQAATNLDGGAGPIDFGGAPAGYVRLTAAEAPGEGNWMSGGGGEREFGLGEVRFYRYARQVVYGGEIDPVGATDSESAIDAAGAADSNGAAKAKAAGGKASEDGAASQEGIEPSSPPENVVNGYGMADAAGKGEAVHGSDGDAMWLLRAEPGNDPWLTVDLGGTYPLDRMEIWNYNAADGDGHPLTDRGLKDVGIYYSLDGSRWTELKGSGYPYRLARADGSERLKATDLDGGAGPVVFGDVPARYVKLVPRGGAGEGNWGAEEAGRTLYGLAELRFYCGAGVAAEPAPEWTGMFSRYDGWTGADGIFSIPLDGRDRPGPAASSAATASTAAASATASAGSTASASSESPNTLFLFSDTYVGQVNPVSKARVTGGIVNNSVALLDGALPDPSKLTFEWAPKTADLSLFAPHTAEAEKEPGSWYWLQDGLALDGKLYLFPLRMAKDPSGPAGFQFAIRGVARVAVPLGADGPDFASQTQEDAPLYRKLPDGGELVFGAGILANTASAGAPNPDGYIYTYGYKVEPTGTKRLLVARAPEERYADFAAWRFWDGRDWSSRIEDAAPLLDGVSPELSVTPMTTGRWQGKYLLVCERDSVGGMVAYSAGDSPAGPFEPLVDLYHTPEANEEAGIFTYNAKAHPHLSAEGELLATYNVNSSSLAANAADADIYHPRWLRIREIAPAKK